MNRFARLCFALIAAGIATALVTLEASPSPAGPEPAAVSTSPDASAQIHVVRVYYFHTTQRCASCRKIEALSEAAIRQAFERQLADGTLEWQPVNLDDPPNQHFTQDYKLYTKSLIVVDLVNGEQARWKNLEKIWELLRDEAAFRVYVEREIRAYLGQRS